MFFKDSYLTFDYCVYIEGKKKDCNDIYQEVNSG